MYTIAVIGDSGVGKSTFINKLRGLKFDPKYKPTINSKEIDIKLTNIPKIEDSVIENKITKTKTIKIVEFGGQTKYNDQNYEKYNFDLVIVMYDLDRKITTESINKYKQIFKDKNIILIGNKSDIQKYNLISDKSINLNISNKILNVPEILKQLLISNNTNKIQ